MSPTVIIIGAAALVFIILAIGAVQIRASRANIVNERLERYSEASTFMTTTDEDKDKKEKPSALSQRLDSMLEDRDFADNWRQQLARADLKLTVGEYLAVHVISMVGIALLAFFILFPGQAVMTIIAGGVGLFLPRLYVSYKQGKRLHMFENQLADILGLWVNSLRSGYSVLQALEAISREAPEPSAGELKRVVQEVQLGIPMDEAFAHLLVRMPSDDLDLVITAVNIQREVGGNLAEILEVISHTIRERIKLKGEVRVLTAQGRITGYVISGLPILLAIFLGIINPDYVGKLFSNRLCGWPMIGIALGMIGVGTALIQRIVDIEI